MHQVITYIFILSSLAGTSYADAGNGTNCTDYRDSLAYAISRFTSCAIQHSRPITLCESCVDFYLGVVVSYHNLTIYNNSDGFCINDYVNLDRLQIVDTLYHSSLDLWNRAKCYECFEFVNNTLTHNRSEETEIFIALLTGFENCVKHSNSNKTIFCGRCVGDYLELNAYYESINNINEKIGVCMDVVDLMNGTRSMWSEKCCNYRKQNTEYIFLASTAFSIIVTILFYVIAKLSTDMRHPLIFRQSRFAESLNQAESSR